MNERIEKLSGKTIQANSKFLVDGIIWSLKGIIPGLDVEINGIRPEPILIGTSNGKTIHVALSLVEEFTEGGIINE